MIAPARVTAAATAIGLAALLAGCGGGGSGGGSEAVDLEAVAATIHCTGDNSSLPQVYGESQVVCRRSGRSIRIDGFGSSSEESNWINTPDRFAPGTVVVGKDYVIEATSGAQAHAFAATLGDTVK